MLFSKVIWDSMNFRRFPPKKNNLMMIDFNAILYGKGKYFVDTAIVIYGHKNLYEPVN